jgi:hypothetical protein
MKIIYVYNGSNLCVDHHAEIVPTKICFGGVFFKVTETCIDYDIVEEFVVAEVVRYGKKIAKCVKVWEQAKDNLTVGNNYEIIRETEKDFTIITDQGVERKYKRDNFQFEII